MLTAGQFIEQTERPTWSLSSNNTVKQALQLMADKNIDAIIVKDQDKLTGIFSERDYARKVVLKGKNSTDTTLAEVMSKELITISSEIQIDASLDAYQKQRDAERQAELEKARVKQKQEVKFTFVKPRKDFSIYGGWVNAYEPINKGKLGSSQSWREEKKTRFYY